MSWIKKLFGISETTETKHEVKTSHFSIEFYPLTKRYYPKYRGDYLKKRYITGIVETLEPYLFSYADYGDTEEQADRIITEFKEQCLKENVVTIKK